MREGAIKALFSDADKKVAENRGSERAPPSPVSLDQGQAAALSRHHFPSDQPTKPDLLR